MRPLLLLVLTMLITVSVFCQRTMIIYKIGSSRKYLYHYGDRLTVIAGQGELKYSGELNGMNDSVITIGTTPIRISDIHKVIFKTYLPGRIRELIIKGGIGLILVYDINNIINNEPVFTPFNLIMTSALITAAVLTIPFNYKKINMDGRWKIIVTDTHIFK